jgi:hypothetical protein
MSAESERELYQQENVAKVSKFFSIKWSMPREKPPVDVYTHRVITEEKDHEIKRHGTAHEKYLQHHFHTRIDIDDRSRGWPKRS